MTEQEHRPPAVIRSWWSALQPDPSRNRPGNRAALAQLRRCAGLVDIVTVPAFHDLWRHCGKPRGSRGERLALAAAVVAHIRRDQPDVLLSRSLGPDDPGNPATATLSPLRLRRLLAVRDDDAEPLRLQLTRLIQMNDDTANVADVAAAALWWNEKTRIRWAFAYWDAPDATPAGATPPETPDTDGEAA